MGNKMKKRVQGSISVLLVAILLPTMILSALMVDISRYNLAKSMISSAGDLAVNSALADYDTVLKEAYGLFAVSQSQSDWDADIEKYFKDTLNAKGIVSGDDSSDYLNMLLDKYSKYLVTDGKSPVDFIGIDIDNFNVKGVDGSSLANPDILKKQIVEYMKYRGPVTFGMSFIDSLKAFSMVDEQSDVIDTQIDAQEKVQDVANASEELFKATSGYDKSFINDNAKTPDEVKVTDYADRIHQYAGKWEKGNYVEINKLLLCFEITKYRGTHNDFIVKELDEEEKGNYINREDARSAVASCIEKLKENSTYENKKKAYLNNTYFNPSKIDEGKFSSVDDAAKQYKEYEEYLYGTGNVSYKNISDIYTELNRFVEAMGSYTAWANEDIENKQGEIEDEEEAYDAAKEKLDEIKEKIKADEEERDDIDRKSNPTDAEKERRAEIIEELKQLEKDKNKQEIKVKNYEGTNGSIQKLKDKKAEYEEELDKYKKQYEKIMPLYESLTSRLSSDKSEYGKYYNCAKSMATTEITNINKQYVAIRNHLSTLSGLLNDAIEKCKLVENEIEVYLGKVGSWENANNAYSNTNSSDDFSENNAQEIESSKKEYDKKQVEEFRLHLEKQKESIDNYLKIINSDGKCKYGDRKFQLITNYDEAVGAIKNSGLYNELKDNKNFKLSDCNNYKDKLLKATTNNDGNEIKKLTTYNPEAESTTVPMNRFACYLYNTYGDKAKEFFNRDNLEEEDKAENNEEDDFKNAKSSITSAVKDTVNKEPEKNSKYKYNYYGKSVSDEDRPSKDKDSKGPKQTSTDEDTTSESYRNQKSIVSDIVSGIKNALKEGRDDLLVLEYIVNNFSYNTQVQHNIVKAGKKTSEVTEGEMSQYLSETMSGYKINSNNNYLNGAEIEYILYGNSNIDKNVGYAKATIFAIRVVCNSIFAFTDSEIKAITLSAGMAVQAATLGIVPYKVVQIALQLALALGESAYDIVVMMDGGDVPIMKSKNTWTMSPRGALNAVKDKVVDSAKDIVSKAIDDVTDGIQKFIDSTADQITDSVVDLSNSITNATKNKAQEMMDKMFGVVEDKVDAIFGDMQFIDDKLIESKTALHNYINGKFDEIIGYINGTGKGRHLSDEFTDPISKNVIPAVSPTMVSIVNNIRNEVITKVDNVTASVASKGVEYKKAISRELTGVISKCKRSFEEAIYSAINTASTTIGNSVSSITEEYTTKINNLVQDKSDQAKDKILNYTDSFIDSNFDKVANKLPDSKLKGGMKNSGSLGSVIMFGYDDYLTMFLFIDLVANEEAVLARTADVIQFNISKAEEGSDYVHKSGGEFLMSKAYTYVGIESELEMKMFFLNTSIFQGQIDEINDEITLEGGSNLIDLSTAQKILYKAVAGY